MTIEKVVPRASNDYGAARDLAGQTLHKLAMQSDLKAQQRADLRRDIAARLLPSEGPFHQDIECTTGR